MKRILAVRDVALAVALAALAAGCGRSPPADGSRPATSLAEALAPARFARALTKLGGAHVHGTARLAAGAATPDDGVTTTTDLWLDRAGNWRLVESNDRDGGREIVRVGRDLFVALRYGKMIRRVAEEPEPTRLVEEALGGPWAAWEIAGPQATLARVGAKTVGGRAATEVRVSRAATRTEDKNAPATAGLRAWRAHVAVDEVAGRALVDDATGALVELELAAKFTTKRDGHELHGAVEARLGLSDVGATPAIVAPPAEDLALRQRLVPEQKELLAGLPTTRGLPPAAPRPRAPAAPAPAASTPPSSSTPVGKPSR